MFCLQATKANRVKALLQVAGKNLQCNMHGSMLYDVLVGHISCIALFAELKAQVIYINSAKQHQGQYIPQESIISKFTKKLKTPQPRINLFLHREQ